MQGEGKIPYVEEILCRIMLPTIYGNKLHCDQNEKLGRYGCTFYAFSDGCSSRIVKLVSMPKKNAVITYAHFRFVDTDY